MYALVGDNLRTLLHSIYIPRTKKAVSIVWTGAILCEWLGMIIHVTLF